MPADPRPSSAPVLQVRLTIARAFSLEAAFEAPAGFTLVTGPSGSGKSTLLGAIAGFVRPTRGRIALTHPAHAAHAAHAADAAWFDSERRVDVAPQHRHVAIVFQSLALFPHLTAAENVAYGASRALDRSARRALATKLLERLRVGHVADRRPATFSGGEAQRVAMARALATAPRAVLLDEPFSALDAALRRDLTADVRELLRGLGVPVILVTHQPDEASAPGDRFVTLDAGRVVSTGVF
jgi:molybdate transport system ATP-binding protein